MSTIYEFRDPLLATDGAVVGFYEREFYMFSNFSSFQVSWRGRQWMTSEHAYQAARFMGSSAELVERMHTQTSAHDAYKLAQANKQYQLEDWAEQKVSVMYEICKAKLQQHPYIQTHLLSTNDEYLVEDSPKDSFWGWGPDKKGRNELGKIWMRLREELRSGKL